jgi:hypothetical protein
MLMDLERRRIVDLLAVRSASSLADWLREHPGVEIMRLLPETDVACTQRAGERAPLRRAKRLLDQGKLGQISSLSILYNIYRSEKRGIALWWSSAGGVRAPRLFLALSSRTAPAVDSNHVPNSRIHYQGL